MEMPDNNWDAEATRLWTETLRDWDLEPFKLHILRLACRNLHLFNKANADLEERGLVLQSASMERKNPSLEAAKITLSGFLSCMKTLDLQDPDEKRKPGSPTAYELFLERTKKHGNQKKTA